MGRPTRYPGPPGPSLVVGRILALSRARAHAPYHDRTFTAAERAHRETLRAPRIGRTRPRPAASLKT